MSNQTTKAPLASAEQACKQVSAILNEEEPKYWTGKPLSRDRAVELCRKLAYCLEDDEEINLLLELVLGMGVSPRVLSKMGNSEVWNYHDELAIFCAAELHQHTDHSSQALFHYITGLGIAEEVSTQAPE